jgi:hypothetical protein
LSSDVFSIVLNTHSGSWIVMILLFALSVIFRKQKVTGMVLRLFYLIMLGTGISMLVQLNFPTVYVVKGILAILLIGVMEMIVGRMRKGRAVSVLWIVWVLLLVIVVLTGYGVISF